MWGAGTALGELPPYFMARAARLSGYDPEDEEDLKEFEELQKKSEQDPGSMVGVIMKVEEGIWIVTVTALPLILIISMLTP